MNGRPLGGWRLPLRIAARDARRSRGRSLLVLVMIALPVLAVTVFATVYATADISGTEAVSRRLGAAEALVQVEGSSRAYQMPDPDDGSATGGSRRQREVLDLAGIRATLGGERPAVPLAEGSIRFRTDLGAGDAEVLETDLADPLTQGLVELTSGRWPRTTDEVLVSSDLEARGPGESLTLRDGSTLTIVGTAESTRYSGYPRAFGLPGAFGLHPGVGTSWLIGGAPVTWDQVKALNAEGALVTSRAVLADPPPDSALDPEVSWGNDLLQGPVVTILVLIVVMVLIEVVLLAGPAFAVGARRQTRTLALIAAAGGTPKQARRVVLASGIVLGVVAALGGVALGIGLAWVAMPIFQRFSDTVFGPFDIDLLQLAGVAAFGVVSALLAAAVPAWLASRQDVVAVLAGRRGDGRPSRRSPLLGLLLLGGGIAGAAYGASKGTGGGGEIPIAVSAILSVLGMILLVPVVVALVARLARRLPLSLRFAARDAARHRTRTVPAVAAVAATVAGVVALGIAVSSDEAENRETYRASYADGSGAITDYRSKADWDGYSAAVRQVAPGIDVEPVLGVSQDGRRGWVEVSVVPPDGLGVLSSWGGPWSAGALVGDRVPSVLAEVDDSTRAAADAVLAEGGVVAFSDQPVDADTARVAVHVHGKDGHRARTTVPALFVPVEAGYATTLGILSPAVADSLDLPVQTAGLALPGPISAAQERDISEVVQGLSEGASVTVERGYQAPDETVIVQLVLAGLGAVLMLGGTLTATFLALSDARPDLATLAAVGAAPRTRRGVAAAYALVVGLVGALLGALVGAVPGVAITYPLTGPYSYPGAEAGPSHYLDVPWLLVLGVVVGLPLLTAALVGLTARGRLPMVARLD